MKTLIDETGARYDVDEETIDAYADYDGPTRRLYDPATGETYPLPDAMFDGGSAGEQTPDPGFPPRTPEYQEKLIEVLLEHTIETPDKKRDALLTSSLLAIGKITSREDYRIARMEVENLIRALYLSDAITEDDSIYIMDQIEFFAHWQLRRSITYDGKPNEREWWTIQSIHKKTEVKGEQPGGGALSALGNLFGKRRY